MSLAFIRVLSAASNQGCKPPAGCYASPFRTLLAFLRSLSNVDEVGIEPTRGRPGMIPAFLYPFIGLITPRLCAPARFCQFRHSPKNRPFQGELPGMLSPALLCPTKILYIFHKTKKAGQSFLPGWFPVSCALRR